MKQIADDVHLITGLPPYAINAYLVGDVLVDAMTKLDAGRIRRALRGHVVTAHVLTHAHPDHQGASHAICTELDIPLRVGELDVPPAEDASLIAKRQPPHPLNTLFGKVMAGPGHPVARALHEGDDVAGFTVLDTPGHSAGHISLWRERDRVLILGDVLNNQHPLLGLPRGLREPLAIFTPDAARNRESIRRLGTLEPATVLFGHGPPHRDPAAFAAFCRSV
ncbi:MBL fold metallo-hydrolase [Paraconexibacter antarcticus]|uniref:MBL fold metallo-hydrolase n=1 Tax=Paraconexibacter antarcticus TaxID=2949664 RepID=A0ABY5DY27_9ACTN|nr:MBL fold metallo-hydrolase [Paraconexibacter antarcticus]UTI66936.1 MBL fold metallo-hydrolase [Paraconexibacter antarcticus]